MLNLRLCVVALTSLVWLAATAAVQAAEPTGLRTWTFEFGLEGVDAGRGKSPGAPIAQDVGLLKPFVSADDFNFDSRLGGNIWLRLRQGAFAVEARYFGGFHFNSSTSGTAPLDWFFSGNPGFVVSNGAVFPFNASYDSRLYSLEGNVRWYAMPQLAVFGGLRWVQLKESLGLVSDATVFQLDTTSHGIGPQIGLDWRVIAPADARGFFLDLDGRVAWLFAQQNASFQLGGSSGSGDDGRDMAATELGATVGLQLTPNADLRLGYRALNLSGVALAPVQVQHANFTAGTVDLVHDNLWIQGVTFGFAVRH